KTQERPRPRDTQPPPTKPRASLGRPVLTPPPDARDHLARPRTPGDRDSLGRPPINGGPQPGPPASTCTVTSLDPDHVTAGGMVSEIVNGTGFIPGAQIEVVGIGTGPNATSYISANQVQTNYLFPQTPGVYQVGVRNPGEQLSNTIPFTVI